MVLNVAQQPTIASSAAERSGSVDACTGLPPPKIEEKTRTMATGIRSKNRNAVRSVVRRLNESIDIKNDILAKKMLVPGNPMIVRQANHAAAARIGNELPTPKIL